MASDAVRDAFAVARATLMDLIQGPPCDEWDATISACIAAIDALGEVR